MIPAVFVVRAFVRSFRQLDELQRMQHLEAFAFAFGATMLVTFGYGFLENVGFPHLAWYWASTILAASWRVGVLLAVRRYR